MTWDILNLTWMLAAGLMLYCMFVLAILRLIASLIAVGIKSLTNH